MVDHQPQVSALKHCHQSAHPMQFPIYVVLPKASLYFYVRRIHSLPQLSDPSFFREISTEAFYVVLILLLACLTWFGDSGNPTVRDAKFGKVGKNRRIRSSSGQSIAHGRIRKPCPCFDAHEVFSLFREFALDPFPPFVRRHNGTGSFCWLNFCAQWEFSP
ncbi:hypothetical protein LEP1GSC187_0480 [Leptospira santarosai str. ZUN179]|uniref:Uncharacterized protein n=1 Tax=Leptospira santarosai str. ZUN179 TaxID=1049985 RepID=M6US08_9LEPT|nr:hypothetical protein LEP1GSC187_0480 [Leptospira santarosai str. ZUN179]